MAPKRIRAVDFRSPPPEYEFADGKVVQTQYLDAAGFQLLDAYEANDTVENLVPLLLAIAPALSVEYINRRIAVSDIVNLIAIGKGYHDVILDALKNVRSGEASSPTKTDPPPSTQDSSTTTPSPPSSPE